MRKRGMVAAFAALLCCLPAIAQANVGTALMWATMLHLYLGNALIGIVEGMLLGLCFRAGKARAVVMMIVGNYVSAWVGGLFLRHLALTVFPPDLYSARWFFWLGVVVAYLMTLALEWPYVACSFPREQRQFKRILKANVTIQTVTYVLLCGWYGMAQEAPLYREADAVPPSEISLQPGLRLYYISDADGDVYTRILGEDKDEWVFDLNSRGRHDRLFVQASEEREGSWNLMALCDDGGQGGTDPRHVMVVEDIGKRESVAVREDMVDRPPRDTWMNFSEAPRLAEARNSDWEFSCGFWAGEGIRATNESTGQAVRIAYETLLAQWYMRNATHLPGDLVVFQMGWDQICVWDVEARQVALLARGRGPVVVVPKTDDNASVP